MLPQPIFAKTHSTHKAVLCSMTWTPTASAREVRANTSICVNNAKCGRGEYATKSIRTRRECQVRRTSEVRRTSTSQTAFCTLS